MSGRSAVRVMVYVPTRQCWVVHATVTCQADLDRELLAVSDRKIRLLPATVAPPLMEKPQYVGPTTEWRVEQAMRMSDHRDATRYYKSPG